MEDQKKLKSLNKLRKEKEARLNQLGWRGQVEKERRSQWEKMYEKFKALKRKYGEKYHIRLKEQPELDLWVFRQLHSKEKLSAWKKKKLNAIKFPWIIEGRYRMELWERMHEQLKAYKKEHGHCDVPQKYKNQALASWVNGQRTKKLTPEQKARLEALGFSWTGEIAEKKWDQSIQELMALKKKNMLHILRAETPLYRWLYQQKKNFHKRPGQKQKMLLKLGIDFNSENLLGYRLGDEKDKLWEHRYRRLVAFKKRFGHCAVPGKWQEDILLGGWVQFQRQLNKRGRLLPKRKEKLSKLGFAWSRE